VGRQNDEIGECAESDVTGHFTANVKVDRFLAKTPSGRTPLRPRPILSHASRPPSSLADVLADVQSGRRRIGLELVGVSGPAWSDVDVEQDEEGLRRNMEERREGEQRRFSRSEKSSESVEYEEGGMGCFGKARNFGGEVAGEVSVGVQGEGEKVKGHVKEGISVRTVIDLARVLLSPDCWKWVKVAMMFVKGVVF